MKQQNKLVLIHPRRMTETENSFTKKKKKSGNNISEMELKLYWAAYKIDTTEKTLCYYHVSVFLMYPKLQSATQVSHTLTKC